MEFKNEPTDKHKEKEKNWWHVPKTMISLFHFPKIYRSALSNFETFMTSIWEKKISAEVQLNHAKQMSLYNFVLRKNNRQLKTEKLKQDILN